MRLRVAALALAVCVTSGCDSFSPPDALDDFSDATTNPAALVSADGWTVVAAVSDGKAYRFPENGPGNSPFFVVFAADGGLSGKVSVNVFGADGRYDASSDGSLQAEPGFQTLVGVSERDAKLSDVFLTELREATRFEISRNTLQVRSADGDGVQFEWNGFKYQAAD